jgi:hypothetical protein
VTAFLLLAALAVVVLHVWSRIVAYWWQHMASLLMTPVFTPSNDHWPGRFGRWLLVALVATLGLLPPVLSIAWTFFPASTSWESLRHLIGMFVTLVCMLLYALLMFGLYEVTREFVSHLRAARKAQATLWQALKSIPDPWVAPGGWLMFGGGGGYGLWQNRYTPDLWRPAAAIVVIGTVALAGYRWWKGRRARGAH